MELTHIETSIERMEEFIGEPGGQQRLIEVLENLGGVRVGRNWSRKTMGFGMKTSISEEIEKDMVVKDLPSNFKRLLRKFADELVIRRPRKKLEELMTGRGTSIIQHLLFVLKVRSTDLCDDVVKKCIEIIFSDEETTKSIVTNSVSAYLVETIILVASESRLKKIWSKHLKGKLESMWQDDIANFVVQRLIDAAQTKELYDEVTDEIHPKLSAIFSFNRPGIGVCLAKACIKFPAAQEKFVDALMSAYHLEPRKRHILVPMMLFPDKSTGKEKNREVWLHGSLMLQYIFRYKNTYDVSKSFLVLDKDETITVATDKSGSHVVESFLQSETVPHASKNEFVHKLLGCYSILQQDRFGTRIVDHLMNNGDKSLKEKIMEELCRPAPIGALGGPRRYTPLGPGNSQHRSVGNHHRSDRDRDHHHHHHHSSGHSGSMSGNSHLQRRPYGQHGHNGGGAGGGAGSGGSSGGGGGWRQDLKRHHHQRDNDDYKERPTKRSYNQYHRQRDDYSSKYRD